MANSKVQVNEGIVIHIFLQNLKNYVHWAIHDKDCDTLKTAYQEAQNAEQKCHSMNLTKSSVGSQGDSNKGNKGQK